MYIYICMCVYTFHNITFYKYISVSMKSRQWFMHLFFAIGVPMFLIGIVMFAGIVFTKRRSLFRKRAAIRTTNNKLYSHLDIDDHAFLNQAFINGKDIVRTNANKASRISTAKKNIISNKGKLNDLSEEKIKFNKLIVEHNIDTHSFVDNRIVYTKRVIDDFPDLHKYLVKLHKIQHSTRSSWLELDNLVKNPDKDDYFGLMEQRDITLQKLIGNTYKMEMNLISKIGLSKPIPVIDGNLKNARAKLNIGAGDTLTQENYFDYLSQQTIDLRKYKLFQEESLRNINSIIDNMEKNRLKL